MNGEPLQESLCVSVTTTQSLKGAQNVRSPRSFSPRQQLEVCEEGLLKNGTIEGQQAIANLMAAPKQ